MRVTKPQHMALPPQDPEYHQVLTKAHVYHFHNDIEGASGRHPERKEVEREGGNLPARAPLPYPPPPISYLQVGGAIWS